MGFVQEGALLLVGAVEARMMLSSRPLARTKPPMSIALPKACSLRLAPLMLLMPRHE